MARPLLAKRWQPALIASAIVLLGFMVAPVACKFSINPNTALFQCNPDAGNDCSGDGYKCYAQTGKSYGICHLISSCKEFEVCNGLDDDCDGVIDNNPVDVGLSCQLDGGVSCGVGTTACIAGVLVCEPHLCAAGTRCSGTVCVEANCWDGIDNDNNGLTDCQDPACIGVSCDLPPDASVMNCGLTDAGVDGGPQDSGPDSGPPDAGASDAGPDAGDSGVDAGPFTCFDGGPLTGLPACVARETICDDCIDNDGDGLTDCEDPDCIGRTCAPGKTCVNFRCQ
jgi:hypothetical protein